MIFNHILAHPGVSFNILKTVFNLNESTLRYHLTYLEKNDQISLGLERGKRLYYPHKDKNIVIRETEGKLGTYQLNQKQKLILETLQRHPGISQKKLAQETSLNRLTLTNNLKKLMDLCIIRKIPDGNYVRYEYIENEQLRFEILKQLVIKLLKKEIDEQTFLQLKRKLE
jgi:predicted transcriptional regulator